MMTAMSSLVVWAAFANPISPFDELQSWALEIPLFSWFLGFAVVLGVVLALMFRRAHRRSRTMSLSWTAGSTD